MAGNIFARSARANRPKNSLRGTNTRAREATRFFRYPYRAKTDPRPRWAWIFHIRECYTITPPHARAGNCCARPKHFLMAQPFAPTREIRKRQNPIDFSMAGSPCSRQNKSIKSMGIGGQRGIRTLETVPRLHTFQACAFDHSATCPLARV